MLLLRIRRKPRHCSFFLFFVNASHFELLHTYFCRCKLSIKLAQKHTKIKLATILQTEQEDKAQHDLLGRYYICDRYGSQTRELTGFPVSILSLGYLIKNHILHGFYKACVICGSFSQSFYFEAFHNSFIGCSICFRVLCWQRALAQ